MAQNERVPTEIQVNFSGDPLIFVFTLSRRNPKGFLRLRAEQVLQFLKPQWWTEREDYRALAALLLKAQSLIRATRWT